MGLLHVPELAVAPPRAVGPNLRLHVIYTGPDTIRASLRVATLLASDLCVKLELLVPTVVPYPLPLNHPTASPSFTEDFLGTLVSDCEVDVDVKVLLCRDREETIPHWLPAESIAVIGRRRRWGPGSSRRLIRVVRRSGHHVIVVDMSGGMQAPQAVLKYRGGR